MTICCCYPGEEEPCEEWASEWAAEMLRTELTFTPSTNEVRLRLSGVESDSSGVLTRYNDPQEARPALVFHRKAISMTIGLDGTSRIEIVGRTIDGECEQINDDSNPRP